LHRERCNIVPVERICAYRKKGNKKKTMRGGENEKEI
tara:strand:- start:349 stop:459 length:111 start_codon:yes stop_codon:yes gene_type:complete